MRFATRVLVLLAPALLATPPEVLGAPEPAELVFSSDGELVIVAPDGSRRTRLRSPPVGGDHIDPAWSPDGSTLAFVRFEHDVGDELPSSRLMLSAADGAAASTLAAEGRSQVATPSWSPDGTRLAYARQTFGRRTILSEIVVVQRDGSGERTLLRARTGPRGPSVSLGEPAWSPDGRTIAYTRVREDRRSDSQLELRAMGADGHGDRLLARDGASADWSPDGSRIAYVSVRDRNGRRCEPDECFYASELYVLDVASGAQFRLTNGKGYEDDPDWSPDGGWIAFASDRNYPAGENPELYSIRSDGACLSWLTNGSAESTSPDWRPRPGASGDPGVCGGLEMPPLVGVDLGPALAIERPRLHWLGRSIAGLFPSRLDPEWRGSVGEPLQYDDCIRFDPARCPPSVALSQTRICDSPEVLVSAARRGTRRTRGALVAGRLERGSLAVLAGGTLVSMVSGDARRSARARILRRALRALRPLGHRTVARRLPAPAVPRRFARRLRRAERLVEAVGINGAVRRLDLAFDRTWVRGQLRLLETLRSGGRLNTLGCRG
jgi:WD40-like Beta Propeller Repeat